MKRSVSLVLLLLLAFAITACSRDPEQRKQEFVESGDRYMAQKKTTEAVIQYRNAVALDPQFGEGRYKLAEALSAAGDTASAAKEYIRAADLLPNSMKAQLAASRILIVGRQFDDARARLEKIIAHDPKNAEALVLMGNALAGLKEFDAAVVTLQSAVDADPTEAFTYANLGALQAVRGDKEAAERVFKRAIEAQPKAVEPHLSLGNYYWAAGRVGEAEAEIKAALALEPSSPRVLRGLAAFYLLTNRPADAERYLKQYAETANDASARITLADYYLRSNKVAEGRAILESVAKEPDGFVPATMRLAAGLYAENRKDEALRLIDAVLEKEPKNETALLIRGRFLLDTKPAEAVRIAASVAETDPGSRPALLLKANAYEEAGQIDQAISAYQDFLKLGDPTSEAQLRLAILYSMKGNHAAATELAALVVKSRPQSAVAHLLLARASLDQGNLDRTRQELPALLRGNPNNADVHLLAADYSARSGDLARARESYERALTLRPDSVPALAGLVQVDFAQKRPEAAKARLEERLAKPGGNVSLFILAGRTFAGVGDTARAEDAFKKAIAADPANMDAYVWLGALYRDQNRLDEAKRQFEQAAEAQPQGAVGAKTMLGVILDLQNKPEDARKAYQEALAINPQAAMAANNLAWSYATHGGNLDEALQLAQTAKAQQPSNATINDTLGWVYYKKGLATLAITALREAAEANPSNATFKYHLGLAYASNQDKANARQVLEAALKLNPKSPLAQDANQALAELAKSK